MLGSITPLGERGRGSRWGITISAYLVGSAVGGAALGAVLGWIGSPLAVPSDARLAVLALALAAGIAFDPGVGGLRLPATHRQVDEPWRGAHPGWVWGGPVRGAPALRGPTLAPPPWVRRHAGPAGPPGPR